MPTITFNAFSFLQKKLKSKNIPFSNVSMDIEAGETAIDVIKKVQLTVEEVEAAFINGKVAPLETELSDGDRLALVPPGTPGPYRVLLGFKNKKSE